MNVLLIPLSLQAHVEALEAEKLDLGDQIGELLVESRNLLQMKMSLSLEVATYRYPFTSWAV